MKAARERREVSVHPRANRERLEETTDPHREGAIAYFCWRASQGRAGCAMLLRCCGYYWGVFFARGESVMNAYINGCAVKSHWS